MARPIKGIAFPVASDVYGGIEMADPVRSIEDSVRMILSVSPGEFFLEPEFGCKVNDMVFLPDSPQTISLAEYYIKQALERWEPRIKLKQVTGEVDPDHRNTVNISIVYDMVGMNLENTTDYSVDMSNN
ncbi:MAG TPA: baseplate protein [Spirochaetaceae bacterium]|nr:baseplate protein [Spirochaetaceae bacterium]